MKPFLPLLLASLTATALAADGFPRVPPTPPEKAEATFETLHGFRMELIAAEPLVASPVDLAYDEDGRAYVVEMRDYPYPEEKNAVPTDFPGTVRLLEDADRDGKYDKATIFADQLAWPTSVCCYKGGVFVAAAPDIWYFKDTDGDGKADVRRKVFTGFSRYNVQAIMNSLRWGLDNKIYGSASGNGGNIRHAERPDDPLIQLTRRDFRFDPVTEKIEAISGGERFGATFDDWGNRFLCNIRNPVQHVVLPLHYLARNPNLVVPSAIHDCAESGDQLRVYRLSPPEAWREFRAQRWALEQANMPRSETIGAGFWTSSSGVCVYRGAAYPEPFRGNVFIGEVAGNLIHRQILERDGVTFKSRRADENT
ncbi:MAG TPA: PVC-type heme-binding CxxCH protein, partial [Pirellulaceae bacterium]|nr:PVC-type heme-binding CxxCH protein [Pirellulaceae bacterium]